MIVTSSEGLLTYGAGINFIPVDGLMKFEISKGNISKRNLEIHSWLEKMAAKQG
ncbi:MAG: YfiR family protein [Bacteroidetes bacterium]|nr:YfiR family protein [Bacteroidota bacterium]